MTQDEQLVKKVEENKKEEISNTITIPLKIAQREVLTRLTREKQKIQEDFQKLNDKEADLITFALGFSDINKEDVENIQPSQLGDCLIVTLKSKELPKKELPKEDSKIDENTTPIPTEQFSN